eukprot:SAG11_NODE_1966_length_3988_cov_16.269221_1_plen_134_part_00
MVYFEWTRDAFRRRLRARGYPDKEIREFFGLVRYANRWKYLRLRHAMKPTAHDEAGPSDPDQPAVLALTLPHSQRTIAMEAQRAIFCLSERSLKQNSMVPIEIRRARHRVALKMGQKLGGKLLEYRCDTQSPS